KDGASRFVPTPVDGPGATMAGVPLQTEMAAAPVRSEGGLEGPEVEPVHRRRPYHLQLHRHLARRRQVEPTEVKRRGTVAGGWPTLRAPSQQEIGQRPPHLSVQPGNPPRQG